jgi:DNA-binding transcriptional LysR family regulator
MGDARAQGSSLGPRLQTDKAQPAFSSFAGEGCPPPMGLIPCRPSPTDRQFIRDEETIEVQTSGPLTFTDPKSMLEERVAGTRIAQVIGWGVEQLLASGALVDLFPHWHGERLELFAFHPSRKHPPAKVRAFVEFCVEVVQRLLREPASNWAGGHSVFA